MSSEKYEKACRVAGQLGLGHLEPAEAMEELNAIGLRALQRVEELELLLTAMKATRTKGLTEPEPPPKVASGDVWKEIIAIVEAIPTGPGEGVTANQQGVLLALCEQRRKFGIEKYGTSLQRGNGRNHLNDALQEALDGMAYAQAADREDLFRAFLYAAFLIVGPDSALAL